MRSKEEILKETTIYESCIPVILVPKILVLILEVLIDWRDIQNRQGDRLEYITEYLRRKEQKG